MMKRAKGATLPEIVEATACQPHSVRGFVSILGSKERRSSRPRTPRANGRTGSANNKGNSSSKRRLGHAPRAAFLLSAAPTRAGAK